MKTDNRPANLALVTHRENIRHTIRTGLMLIKLTEDGLCWVSPEARDCPLTAWQEAAGRLSVGMKSIRWPGPTLRASV